MRRAEVAAISDPRLKVNFLVRLAGRCRNRLKIASERCSRRRSSRRGRLPAMPVKIITLAPMIKELLDLGMVESARLLVDEGLKILDSRPPRQCNVLAGGFLAQLARLDPAQALARIQKMPEHDDRDDCYGDAAIAIACFPAGRSRTVFRT